MKPKITIGLGTVFLIEEPKQMKKQKSLYDRVLEVTFIEKLSAKKKKEVENILDARENFPHDIANMLCECLHIDKRYNRSAILKELNKSEG